MNTLKVNVLVFASLLSSLYAAQAQSPVISSFSQNGELVCTNLAAGSVASVEWASSLSGPWQTNWAGLDAVVVDSNRMIRVSGADVLSCAWGYCARRGLDTAGDICDGQPSQ